MPFPMSLMYRDKQTRRQYEVEGNVCVIIITHFIENVIDWIYTNDLYSQAQNINIDINYP